MDKNSVVRLSLTTWLPHFSYGMIGLGLIIYFYLLEKFGYMIAIVLLESTSSRISNDSSLPHKKKTKICNVVKSV